MYAFYQAPRVAEVYNMGGGVQQLLDAGSDRDVRGDHWQRDAVVLFRTNRIGDHIWYVSDLSKSQAHYPIGRCNTTSRRFCARCTSRIASAGCPDMIDRGKRNILASRSTRIDYEARSSGSRSSARQQPMRSRRWRCMA